VNKLSSALGAILVMAIAIVFIVQFQAVRPNATKADTGPQCAVEVRGSCIASAPSYKAARRLIGANADQSRLRSMGFGKKVADGLIEAWVLGEDAKRLGVAVSDDEVTAEIATGRAHVSLPATDLYSLGFNLQLMRSPDEDLVRQIPVKSPKTKRFDAKYAEKQIRFMSMMSPAEFRDYQRGEIVAARMREIVRARVHLGEAEAFERFSQEKSTVTLDYARFDRRFFADLLVDMSPKAVDAWAEAHKEELDKVWESRKAQILPECRSVREISSRLGEAPTDEEKAKARAKIDRAKARLDKGEDFGDVARAMSDGDTATRGGDIGCLLKGKAPKPLEDAVFALAAGKTTDVLSIDSGFYLIKLDQIAKDDAAEKLGRLQTAREIYLGHEAERLAVEASKKVAAAVKGGKTLKEALDLFLAELVPSKAPPKDAADKDKKDKDKKDDDKKDKDDRPALTFQNHPGRPVVETTLPFNISNDPIPGVRQSTELARTAFGLQKPGDAPADAIPFDSGYLVIQLKEKTPASKEQWEKNKEFYVDHMRAQKQNDALIAYVKHLRDQHASDAKIGAGFTDDKATTKGGGDNAPPPSDDEDPGE
jgi:peptidyl-prolyl cis-trans isomerase D